MLFSAHCMGAPFFAHFLGGDTAFTSGGIFFPRSARGTFRPLHGREGFAPPILYTALCTPLFFFSLRKKKKSVVHGVEEKEGLSPSVCAATPTGAEYLSYTFHFSCGLRPKAAETEKSRATILLHLSRVNNIDCTH